MKPGSFMSFRRLSFQRSMKRAGFALPCLTAAIACLSVQVASTQRQREIRVTSQHIDGGLGELMSIEALVGHSDAVIVGHVDSSRPSNIAPSGY